MNKQTYAGQDCLELIHDDSQTFVVFFHGYGASMNDLAPLSRVMFSKFKPSWFFPNGKLPIMQDGMEFGRCWFDLRISELQNSVQNQDFAWLEKHVWTEMLPHLGHTEKILEELPLDYEKTIIGGFSQGSIIGFATAQHLAEKQRPKGLCLFSPSFVAADHWEQQIKKLGQTPIFVSHGRQDFVLPFSQTKRLVDKCKDLGANIEFVAFNGGHEIPQGVLYAANDFFNDQLSQK